MSKIQDFAVYVTTAQKSTFTGLDGNSRLNVVNNYYNEKGLEKPAAIVVTTQKRGAYLSKDEKLTIQSVYIAALKAGKVSEEIEANFEAVSDPAKVATFSRSLP